MKDQDIASSMKSGGKAKHWKCSVRDYLVQVEKVTRFQKILLLAKATKLKQKKIIWMIVQEIGSNIKFKYDKYSCR